MLNYQIITIAIFIVAGCLLYAYIKHKAIKKTRDKLNLAIYECDRLKSKIRNNNALNILDISHDLAKIMADRTETIFYINDSDDLFGLFRELTQKIDKVCDDIDTIVLNHQKSNPYNLDSYDRQSSTLNGLEQEHYKAGTKASTIKTEDKKADEDLTSERLITGGIIVASMNNSNDYATTPFRPISEYNSYKKHYKSNDDNNSNSSNDDNSSSASGNHSSYRSSPSYHSSSDDYNGNPYYHPSSSSNYHSSPSHSSSSNSHSSPSHHSSDYGSHSSSSSYDSGSSYSSSDSSSSSSSCDSSSSSSDSSSSCGD